MTIARASTRHADSSLTHHSVQAFRQRCSEGFELRETNRFPDALFIDVVVIEAERDVMAKRRIEQIRRLRDDREVSLPRLQIGMDVGVVNEDTS